MTWIYLKKGTTADIYINNNKTLIKKVYFKPYTNRRLEWFKNEIDYLFLLEKYDNFPKLLFYDKDDYTLIIEYCGISLKENRNVPDDFIKQIDKINEILDKYKINHNDIKTKNICVKDNTLFLIDFQLATIGNENLKNKIFFKKIIKTIYQQDKLHK